MTYYIRLNNKYYILQVCVRAAITGLFIQQF